MGLTLAEANAVVRLAFSSPSSSEVTTCSGVLLGDVWVATARHCLGGRGDVLVEVTFGAQPGQAAGSEHECAALGSNIGAKRTIAHEKLDLLLVELSVSPSSLGIAATPLAHGGDETLRVGDRLELAGFGLTQEPGAEGRSFVVESVSEVGSEQVLVDGRGVSGACLGDSGGPLLWREPSGRVGVVGILSGGSRDCLGTDAYVRLSAAAKFITDNIEPHAGTKPRGSE